MEEKSSRIAGTLACAAIPLAAGAAVGLLDAGFATRSASGPGTFYFYLLTASLGATLAVSALLPFLCFSFISWGRHPETQLAGTTAATILLPVAFVLGKFLYKRLPWGGADVALAVATALALILATAAGTRILGRLLAPRMSSWIARGSRAAVPLLLMTIPALARAIPALRAELAARRCADAAAYPAAALRDELDPDNARTSLLLLSIDTMRADRLGSSGDPRTRTPHLDRLARASTQFTECRTVSPWTLPSLATLLTGTYPGEHRMLEELTALADSVPDLADVLRRGGFRTAAFVSNPWLATGNLGRGFDTFDVAERVDCFAAISSTRIDRALAKTLLRVQRLDSGRAISGRGIAWVGDAERAGQPWFLWLHYFDPHLPNWPGAPLDRLGGTAPSHVGASITVEEIRAGQFGGGEEGRAEIARLYDAEVVATDLAIARILRALESGNALDRTVVIVTGDHGEEFWEHGGYGHGHTMYDEVLRVPLFVRGPSIPAGRVDGRRARLLDVAPTAVAALDASMMGMPRGFTGDDLLEAQSEPDTTYGEATLYGPEQKLLLAGPWKLVVQQDAAFADSAEQLFDLAADPAERHDLAASSRSTTDALLAGLAFWKQRLGSNRSTTSEGLPAGVDPAVLEQLEKLGYIHRR